MSLKMKKEEESQEIESIILMKLSGVCILLYTLLCSALLCGSRCFVRKAFLVFPQKSTRSIMNKFPGFLFLFHVVSKSSIPSSLHKEEDFV